MSERNRMSAERRQQVGKLVTRLRTTGLNPTMVGIAEVCAAVNDLAVDGIAADSEIAGKDAAISALTARWEAAERELAFKHAENHRIAAAYGRALSAAVIIGEMLPVGSKEYEAAHRYITTATSREADEMVRAAESRLSESERVAGELRESLAWAVKWVAEEIEPCRRSHAPETCPWRVDHVRLERARALVEGVTNG